jgi:hypothetical protein
LRIKHKQLISAAVAVAVIAALITLAQDHVGQTALRKIGVVGSPAHYSELAFVDPAHLPDTLRPTPSPMHIAFTVTNHVSASQTYGWEIDATGASSRVLASGTLEVAHGRQAYLDPEIILGCSRRTRVTVRLTSGDSIDFWAKCLRQPKRGRRGRARGRARQHSLRVHRKVGRR